MSNVYAAPDAPLSDDAFATETVAFALNGRIGRLRYVAYAMGLYILVVFAMTILMIPVAMKSIDAQSLSAIITPVFAIIMVIAYAIIARRRLHDLGMSAWFILCMLIPFVNLYFGLIMLFKRGDEGSNEYGAQPMPNSIGVKLLAFSMPAIALVGIAAAIVIPMLK